LYFNKSKSLLKQQIKLLLFVNTINNINDDFEYYIKDIKALQYNIRKNNNNINLSLIVTNYKRKILQY